MTRFKEILQSHLSGNLSAAEFQLLPAGFQQIGDKAIINLPPELENLKSEIAQIILDSFNNIKGVYSKTGAIQGKYRTPQLEFLHGEDAPEIVHREHGILYKFDITKIMFAKGNINERARIAALIQPGETIFDLFAGIGYFSLAIGATSKPHHIYAFEWNPTAFHYLVENIQLNKINQERPIITPILGDSRTEAFKIPAKADRVIMGVLPAPKEHIITALQITKKHAIIHYEALLDQKSSPEALLVDFQQPAANDGRRVALLQTTRVKPYGPKLDHVTLDLSIS